MIEEMKRLLAAARDLPPFPTGCRMHPETIERAKVLSGVTDATWSGLIGNYPLGAVPVYADATVAIGDVEWDYPETDVTE